MAEIICDCVSRGMRREERTVSVRDAVTRERSWVRVDADFLSFHMGKYYLPVGVIQDESQQGLLLVELTQPTDGGAARLWVRTSDVLSAVKPEHVRVRKEGSVMKATVLQGVVHGRTIELDQELGLPDGQPVTVTVEPGLPRGEGIRQSAGAWADAGQELDDWLDEMQRGRQQDRPEIP